MFNFIERG